MSGVRAVQSAKDLRLLKVRASGIRVAHSEYEQLGTVYNLKGPDLVEVWWDAKEDADDSWGEYRVGADADGQEHYDLSLAAVHSYVKVSGAAMADDTEDDAKELNGIYVMGPASRPLPPFFPEYYQITGERKLGRISYDEDEERWILWSTVNGRGGHFYQKEGMAVDLPEEGWEAANGWEEIYEPAPTITKHQLEEGQDVILRKFHPDTHIPADKYPGPPCLFTHGDLCTVHAIDGLFFAPKISPDQWIPIRAAVPAELLGEDAEDAERLVKMGKPKAGAKAKAKAKGKAKAKAQAGNGQVLKMLTSLVDKVGSLETEVKNLQK